MASPVVSSLTTSTFSTGATSHAVSMPATVNSGDLLIAMFVNNTAEAVTTPSGWTQLHSTANGNSTGQIGAYYKIAAGTEGGTTVDFVTAGSRKAVAHAYRITSWHGTTPPEAGTALATGSTNAPNPPSLTPSWGADDTLWLTFIGCGVNTTASASPTNYTDLTSTLASATTSAAVHSARRELNASPEDPGTFSTVTAQWVASTLGVRPSAGGGAQSLTGALFTKAPTFPTGAITAGAVSLTGSLFTKTHTLPTGVITATANLAGVLFTKTHTFPTGAITATRNLAGVLFTKTHTFPTGVVSAGAVNLAGVLFTKTHTFPTGAVSLGSGPQALTGVLFDRTPTFPTGTVTAGAVSLTGGLFTKTHTFPTGVVSALGAPQALNGTLFTKTHSFPTGTVTAGVVSLTGVLFTKAHTFPTGIVALLGGPQALTGVLFINAPTFPNGTIGISGTIFGNLFVNTPVFFTGSMSQPGPTFWSKNSTAFVKVGPGDTPPWGTELSGQPFLRAPTFPVGSVT